MRWFINPCDLYLVQGEKNKFPHLRRRGCWNLRCLLLRREPSPPAGTGSRALGSGEAEEGALGPLLSPLPGSQRSLLLMQ